ncbi:MAG: deoxyribonuclease IV [bacterium]|nr:deoxyribonuclease IV [bacterium]
MKIGAHVSIAGGFEAAQQRALAIGCNCLQIFSSSPRGWDSPDPNINFKFALAPVYFHATYLINLANGGEIGEKSKKLLIAEMNLASKLGIKGSIIHLGSYISNESLQQEFGDKILFDNINEVLNKTSENTLFIIENSGNKKIGQKMEEIQEILDKVNNPRVRVCLDTCHLFAAGYHFEEIEKLPFLDKVELIHINDSRDPFGSGRDRHENIGHGLIGLNEFKSLINNPKLKHLPFILEVPGVAGTGPDEQNIQTIISLLL